MEHKNLHSYDNYELFTDNDLESNYRESKLLSSEQHVNFIKKKFENKKINVVELGSGNSKTLFNLSLSNVLNHGYGFEISKSRHRFAQKWKEDLKIQNVENILDDFMNIKKHNVKNIDLFFIVDIAFQFCEPIKQGSDKKLLFEIYDILNIDGKLILEIDGCGKIINSTKINNKIWEEFDDKDPWQFSLWDCKYNEDLSFLYWDKTFINRNDNSKCYSSVVLKIYKKNEITNLLKEIGFKNINLYSDWDLSEYKDDYGNYIIVCEK
jgi:hypothetical protein